MGDGADARVSATALFMQEEVPDAASRARRRRPYYRRPTTHRRCSTCGERRLALDGRPPPVVRRRKPPVVRPIRPTTTSSAAGQPGASRRWRSPACCRNLVRRRAGRSGSTLVPIIPDEARTFGLDALFREIGILRSQGQLYDPVDAGMPACRTRGAGRSAPRGGHHRGRSMASLTPPALPTPRTA